MSNFGVFFRIDNALYSIAFGTHTKTAELIEMPFGLMTWVDHRYHVLHGGPDPQRERGSFGENVASHCKVMGHSTMLCAQPAEPIEMPFSKSGGPTEPCIGWGADASRGRGNFRIVRAIQKHW